MGQDIEICLSADRQVQLDVSLDQDTVWLSQEKPALLFERDQSVISRHMRNVFKEGEPDEE